MPVAEEDKFWAASAEAGVVVILVSGGVAGDRTPSAPKKFIGRSGSRVNEATEYPPEIVMVQEVTTQKNLQIVWFINSGIIDRVPTLKIALIDAGAGWLPTMAELLDWHYRYSQFVSGWKIRYEPMEYLRRNFKFTVREEPTLSRPATRLASTPSCGPPPTRCWTVRGPARKPHPS